MKAETLTTLERQVIAHNVHVLKTRLIPSLVPKPGPIQALRHLFGVGQYETVWSWNGDNDLEVSALRRLLHAGLVEKTSDQVTDVVIRTGNWYWNPEANQRVEARERKQIFRITDQGLRLRRQLIAA